MSKFTNNIKHKKTFYAKIEYMSNIKLHTKDNQSSKRYLSNIL